MPSDMPKALYIYTPQKVWYTIDVIVLIYEEKQYCFDKQNRLYNLRTPQNNATIHYQ